MFMKMITIVLQLIIVIIYLIFQKHMNKQSLQLMPLNGRWMAMQEEIKALQENDAFELTSLPEGRTSVGGGDDGSTPLN